MDRKRVCKDEFSKRLKRLIEENNETIYTIAEVVHLTPATISRYTTADMAPKITTVEVLARYFRVSPVWLMGYDVPKHLEEEAANSGKEKTGLVMKLIKETGMSQKAFAVKAGLSYAGLRSMLERGIGSAPVDSVLKVYKALGITVEELEEMAGGSEARKDIHTIAAHFNGKEISAEKIKRIENFIKFTLEEDE